LVIWAAVAAGVAAVHLPARRPGGRAGCLPGAAGAGRGGQSLAAPGV